MLAYNRAIKLLEFLSAIYNRMLFVITGGSLAFIWFFSSALVPGFARFQGIAALSLLIVAFFIATYRAWWTLKLENERLNIELAMLTMNPVDYTFHGEVFRLGFDEEELLRKSAALKEEAQREMDTILGSSKLELMLRLATDPIKLDDWKEHLKNLEAFDEEVKKAGRILSGYRKVNLSLENVGNIYDESLSVRIHLREGTISERIDGIVEEPQISERPKARGMFDMGYDRYANLTALMGHNRVDLHPFRTHIRVSAQDISVELKEMRAREIEDVLCNGFFVRTDQEEIELECEVSSKHTKQPIRKTIILKMGVAKEMNPFEKDS